MPKRIFLYRIYGIKVAALIFTVGLMFFCTGLTEAQSGRRAPSKPPVPASEKTEPEPSSQTTSKVDVKPEFSVKVVSNIPLSIYRQLVVPEKMHRWVVDRLKSSLLLKVESGASANLKEAKEMAKNSDDTFIVLLELHENNFATPPNGGTLATIGEVWIHFYVLTPGTGKLKQQGRGDLKPELLRNQGGILNRQRLCHPILTNEDFLLLQASFETAERIMAGFNVPVRPVECKNF